MDYPKYELSPDEFNECASQAELAIFLKGEREEHPKSFWIVGQPGAGKTALTRYIINQNQDFLSKHGYIQLDPEVVGIYHKYYKLISEEYPEEQYEILQRFTRTCTRQIFKAISCNKWI